MMDKLIYNAVCKLKGHQFQSLETGSSYGSQGKSEYLIICVHCGATVTKVKS